MTQYELVGKIMSLGSKHKGADPDVKIKAKDEAVKLLNDYLESKADNLPISDVRASAIQVAKDLAEWSNKYPRGRIYGMNRKDDMDGQLIKLEERAKELLPHLP